MIPWSLVCYNWTGVKPLDGTKRKRVRYHRLTTSAKVVTRVAVGAGMISELQGANATKYRNFAASAGRTSPRRRKGREVRERKHRQFLEVSGELLGTYESREPPGKAVQS